MGIIWPEALLLRHFFFRRKLDLRGAMVKGFWPILIWGVKSPRKEPFANGSYCVSVGNMMPVTKITGTKNRLF